MRTDQWMWFLAIAVKPFIMLALFTLTYWIARFIAPLIPNGRLKSLVYDRGLRGRHPWKFAIGFAVAFFGVIFLFDWIYH
jgi:hypothetical protein